MIRIFSTTQGVKGKTPKLNARALRSGFVRKPYKRRPYSRALSNHFKGSFLGRPRGFLPGAGGLFAFALDAAAFASLVMLPRICPILIGLLQWGHLIGFFT